MKIFNMEHSMWPERYRPQCLEDLIIPEKERSKIQEWVNKKEIPHLGVFGDIGGTGKTSLMNVIIKELDTETLRINGSKDNGIDDMRYTISGFANSMSISGNKKLVCIDESDYLTVAAQSTLRTDLEVYSTNTRFIFTGNYTDRLIPQLLQRLSSGMFDLDEMFANNKKELGIQIFNRLKFILENEEVEYEPTDVMEIVKKFYPSVREMISFMSLHTVEHKLDFTDIKSTDEIFGELVTAMKSRKFKEVKTVVDGLLIPDNAYSYFWKHIDEIFEIQSQPTVIMLLADYQDFSIRARNKYIPLGAMVTKIIGDSDVKFKKE